MVIDGIGGVKRVGDASQVNTSTFRDQYAPLVVVLSDGRYVVLWNDRSGSGVWENGTDLKAQIFNTDGTKYGGEISVNSTVRGDQQYPSIAPLAGGGFVVTWMDYPNVGWSDGRTTGRAQIFAADGSKVGGEFTVSSSGRSNQGGLRAVGLNDGSFILAWSAVADNYALDHLDIFAQHYSATGARLGGEFRINSTQTAFQTIANLVATDDGGFIAIWRDDSRSADDPSGTATRAQIFDASTNAVGGEFLVNTTTEGNQFSYDVIQLDAGGFLVVFGSTHSETGSVKAQQFDDGGNRIGTEFELSLAIPEAGRLVKVYALAQGGFMALWTEGEIVVETTTEYDYFWDEYRTVTTETYVPHTVHAQVLDANGQPVGDPFQVDQTAGEQDQHPGLAMLTDGSFVIVWQDNAGWGYGDYDPDSEILSQRFKFAGALREGTDTPETLGGTAYDDTINGYGGYDALYGFGGDDILDGGNDDDMLYGGDGNDVLMGGSGNDSLNGGTGADDMHGGSGSDTYWVDDAGDTVTELADEGVDTVYSSIGITLGDNLENLTLVDGGNAGTGNGLANVITADPRTGATLDGGGGADVIFASKQSDTVHGGEGDDTIYGYSGFDLIYGGDGNDAIFGGGKSDVIHGGGGQDNLQGGNGWDEIFGGEGNDFLKGQKGHDTLDGGEGNDDLLGGEGRDVLTGGAGMDVMEGGTGTDRFVFRDGDFAGLDGATADRIVDLRRGDGDLIDLSAIDAIEGGTDDAFAFVGKDTFSGTAGELRYEFVDGYTMLFMDVNGDAAADYAIRVDGTLNLLSGDFML
ncbi:MAG: calcium-binding protein [Alteraurantiacibacter sp.]